MVQIISSTGIYLPTAGPHSLPHHFCEWIKSGISEKEGSFKEEENFLKKMEAKMTSYNILYCYKMAAYYYKMTAYYYKMIYDNMFHRGPFHRKLVI
jgi:hypothetical protein